MSDPTPGSSPEFNQLPPEFEEKMKARRRAARAARQQAPGDDRVRPFGAYTLLEEIGEGPAGKVWMAQAPDQATVAVKILRGSIVKGVEEPGAREQMARSTLASLAGTSHPRRIGVREVVDVGSQVGIVMDLATDPTLDDRLRRGAPLPFPLALRVGAHICEGLTSLHQAGVIHGDLKARNVFLSDQGEATLSEPGTARDASQGTNDRALALAGTPTSFAPELFDGAPVSVATDVYATGVLLFHALTRTYPAKGPLVRALRDAHRHGERRRLAEVAPQIPRGVAEVVERALAPAPEDRYPDAASMREALLVAAEIPLDQARRDRASGLARWWMDRPPAVRRAILLGGVAALFALLIWRSA